MTITLLMKWDMFQTVIQHPALNASDGVVAGRLLHHLNTQTGQCNPSYSTVAEATGLSRDTVMKAVQQLEATGFLKVERSIEAGQRATKGQRLPSNSFSFEWSKISTTPSRKFRLPQSKFSATPIGNSDHPQPKITTRGSRKFRPKQGKKETGKEEAGNLNHIADDLALPIDLPIKRKQSATEVESYFQEFMLQYPKPEDVDAARKAYGRALKKATVTDLLNGAMRYAAEKEGSDPQYIKSPRNWLDAGSWKNPPRPPFRKTPSRADSAIEGILEGMDAHDWLKRQDRPGRARSSADSMADGIIAAMQRDEGGEG